ncbi:MAG: ASCH domain-containing protein [Clostridia bacterium]|nr:ASCH domain-containing protein [Clostridia bacterium]
MTAEEMWKSSGLSGEYGAWAFGDDADKLAELVKNGTKTATCSAYVLYGLENEELPQVGDYSVILDSHGHAVCIVRTTKVYLAAFDAVTQEHAYKEGEGDRSLAYWRRVHQEFFTKELKEANLRFDEKTELVCEEFEVVG